MGKQIQIYTTEKDNKLIQDYLLSNYECIFLKSFAPSKKELIVENLSASSMIYIWNKEFNWSPEYKQTITKEKLFYISNHAGAPLIEFCNTNWNNEKDRNGRIYWEKFFVTNDIHYDLTEFDKFYNSFIRWLKKTSYHIEKYFNSNYYYFENAWKKATEENLI